MLALYLFLLTYSVTFSNILHRCGNLSAIFPVSCVFHFLFLCLFTSYFVSVTPNYSFLSNVPAVPNLSNSGLPGRYTSFHFSCNNHFVVRTPEKTINRFASFMASKYSEEIGLYYLVTRFILNLTTI